MIGVKPCFFLLTYLSDVHLRFWTQSRFLAGRDRAQITLPLTPLAKPCILIAVTENYNYAHVNDSEEIRVG